MRRLFLLLVVFSLVVLCAGGLCTVVGGGLGGLAYYKHVVQNPGDHVRRENIMAAIAQESSVYFEDGKNRVGVLFEQEHRVFLSGEQIPPAYIVGLISAEDGGFWNHYGVAPLHIVSAMVKNLRAGRVVAGGSTLSQQAAKNLFDRPDRSLASKWGELVNTLRLEAHYTKLDILTFYVNQFYVAGNGRGLAIGARYFFDKESVDELSVLECAYLAGLVKGPSNYDPFLGKKERQERSNKRAHERTRYVLRRMSEEDPERIRGPVSLAEVQSIQEEARRLLKEGFQLPFQRGTFRYDSSSTLEAIGRRLTKAPIKDVLEKAGIANPQTAGLQIRTTLNHDAQREANYALTHHLTVVGVMLERVPQEKLVLPSKLKPKFQPEQHIVTHEIRTASIKRTALTRSGGTMVLDLGGVDCTVDQAGTRRLGKAVYRGGRKSKYAKPTSKWMKAFVQAFEVKQVVLASVREIAEDGAVVCDIEYRPQLQGAVTVVQDGALIAMLGGTDNRNYDRSNAPRQLGSTWKPLVYHAALEMGWLPTDLLDNRLAVFSFGTVFYYPKADHTPNPEVTMSWAGVRSENLASVWLLYHLTDHLSITQLDGLAKMLDLAPRAIESEGAYRRRMQELGVLQSRRRLAEVQFLKGRTAFLQTVEDWRYPEDKVSVQSILYGWGFESERRRWQSKPAYKRLAPEEALRHAWVPLKNQLALCREQFDALRGAVMAGQSPPLEKMVDLHVEEVDGKIQVACGVPPGETFRAVNEVDWSLWRFAQNESGRDHPVDFMEPAPVRPPKPAKEYSGIRMADGRKVRTRRGRRTAAGTSPVDRTPPPTSNRPLLAASPTISGAEPTHVLAGVDEMWMNGRLRVATLDELAQVIDSMPPLPEKDLYHRDLLYWSQDFRILLNMKFLVEMARQYGVRSNVRLGMTLPLGAAEITIEEATRMYEGLISGERIEYEAATGPTGSLPAGSLLISEIRDATGTVLYQVNQERRKVSQHESASMTADILANVVRHGTGRQASKAVRAGRYRVPLGGKTGTTNQFRNSAFLGFAPKWIPGGFSPDEGYTVGVYVGYDDNRPMKTGGIVLAGSSGALPVWTQTVKGMAETGLLGTPVRRGGSGLLEPEGDLIYQNADVKTGLPDIQGTGAILTRKALDRKIESSWKEWER